MKQFRSKKKKISKYYRKQKLLKWGKKCRTLISHSMKQVYTKFNVPSCWTNEKKKKTRRQNPNSNVIIIIRLMCAV